MKGKKIGRERWEEELDDRRIFHHHNWRSRYLPHLRLSVGPREMIMMGWNQDIKRYTSFSAPLQIMHAMIICTVLDPKRKCLDFSNPLP